MITIFVHDFNNISQDFYDYVIENTQIHRLTCSCGHSACLNIHGYYVRTIKLHEGSIRLKILRVKCSHCGRTHAILLSSIVPYSQIPLSDQHKIILDFESGTPVYSTCDENSSIDENNVKYIIRQYTKHWREMIRSLRIQLSDLISVVKHCFSNYSVQFMQNHRCINSLFSKTT